MTTDQLKSVAALLEGLLETEENTDLALQGQVSIIQDGSAIAYADLHADIKPEVTTP